MKSNFIILLNTIIATFANIQLYHLDIHSNTQAYTLPFSQTQTNTPSFAYFIEQGTIENTEFSLYHNTNTTVITKSQLTITFEIIKSFGMRNGQSLTIGLMVADEPTLQFQIGIKKVNISSSILLQFQNMVLISNGMKRASLKLYSLAFPIIYHQIYNQTLGSIVELDITKHPATFSQMAFSYVYYSIQYIGFTVFATYSEINHNHYNYQVLFNTFAFQPSASNVVFAMRKYDSMTAPFFKAQKFVQYSYMDIGNQSVFLIGYNFSNGLPSQFHADLIAFNHSYTVCSNKHFLYSLKLYQTLPLSCNPCHPTCLTCASNQTQFPQQTDQQSCSSCHYLKYMNLSQGNSGSCICLKGLEQINYECVQCDQSCLYFDAQFIQITKYGIFLLRFSQLDIRHLIQLKQNLEINIEGFIVDYDIQRLQESVYSIKISSQNMMHCSIKQCQVNFLFTSPEKIESHDGMKNLHNVNKTVFMKNYIDIKNYLPSDLGTVFQVLGLSVGATYSGGYSSLMKVLFQSEQMINIHRYLNLQLPIIFNQLVNEMENFRFLDLTNFFPNNINQVLTDQVSNQLDNKGPSKLIYYDSGINFYKNSISGILSCIVMILINLTLYFFLSKIPIQAIKTLAKKIKIRRMVTIHDILEQLQLPLMHYALEQLQISLLKTQVIWLYGLALITSLAILLFPFMVITYVYLHRKDDSRKQIFEDLMQDNKMDRSVTYVYYVFNYYRKICFASFLLSNIPGLIQIYFLIIINTVHFAFQIYLIVTQVYLSIGKVVVRFINTLCIIFLEILIVLYNANNYGMDSMINIGLICIYISLATTVLCLADFIIKVGDTIFQEIKKKQRQSQQNAVQQVIRQQLIRVINCGIGNQLQTRDKTIDKRESKFIQDKQLMQLPFQQIQEQSRSNISQFHNRNAKTARTGQNNLVYIDDDWIDVYPMSSIDQILLPPTISKPIIHYAKEQIINEKDESIIDGQQNLVINEEQLVKKAQRAAQQMRQKYIRPNPYMNQQKGNTMKSNAEEQKARIMKSSKDRDGQKAVSPMNHSQEQLKVKTLRQSRVEYQQKTQNRPRDIKRMQQQLYHLSQLVKRDEIDLPKIEQRRGGLAHEDQGSVKMTSTSKSKRAQQLRVKRSSRDNPNKLVINKIEEQREQQDILQDVISNHETYNKRSQRRSRYDP